MHFNSRRTLLALMSAASLLVAAPLAAQADNTPNAVRAAQATNLYSPLAELDGVATQISFVGPLELIPEIAYLKAIQNRRGAAIKLQLLATCDNDQFMAKALKSVEMSLSRSQVSACNNDDPEHDLKNALSATSSRKSRKHLIGVIMKRVQARITQAVGCMKAGKVVFKGCPKYRLANEMAIASAGARLDWFGPCTHGVSEIKIRTPLDSGKPLAEVTPCTGKKRFWDLTSRVEPNDLTAVTDDIP
ncbi:MAG TPA: hypothetical protein VMR98_05200, partial [Candidatus Polarisedimenticolaceae bacterium]|nr:hypothetical protein [Candidatus Polarisedimenticolaceae bacterium]